MTSIELVIEGWHVADRGVARGIVLQGTHTIEDCRALAKAVGDWNKGMTHQNRKNTTTAYPYFGMTCPGCGMNKTLLDSSDRITRARLEVHPPFCDIIS